MNIKTNYSYQPLKYEVLYHILFWLLHIFYRWSVTEPTLNYVYIDLMVLVVKMALTYFTIHYLLCRLLLNKELTKFFIFLVISIVIALLLRRFVVTFIAYPLGLIESIQYSVYWDLYDISRSFVHIYSVVVFASMITLVRIWNQEQLNKFQLLKENLEAELMYLKVQIHPHFLFNTINNIYSTSINKKELTSDLLLKLSDVLRYIIYESDVQKISVQKEIEMIKSYIELEKIRYGKRLHVDFNIKGDTNSISIPPLIFLPFVENSFKHGAAESIEDNWITIDLELSSNKLIFKVENSLAVDRKKDSNINQQNGIGLENLRKRLSLIYKDHYELKIFDEKDTYLAIIIIEKLEQE